MPSPTYTLIITAMEARSRIACVYRGLHRELCPIILGHREGREKLLAFQVGGQSSKPLTSAASRWRCLFVDELSEAALVDGPWQAGDSHQAAQSCVREVDLDINPASPFHPSRRLGWQG